MSNKKLAIAALAGLLSATVMAPTLAHAGDSAMEKSTSHEQAKEKHACKGQNSCKGNSPDGKNECKGKSECSTLDKK